jgi:hypothetical protein
MGKECPRTRSLHEIVLRCVDALPCAPPYTEYGAGYRVVFRPEIKGSMISIHVTDASEQTQEHLVEETRTVSADHIATIVGPISFSRELFLFNLD